jgi:hypothetical protein
MASESGSNFWLWPFSGDVVQDYHPVTTWLRTMMGQFGFIHINEMQSDDPDLEKRIVNEVGSYGKQLGRVVEALQAVCAHLDVGKLARDEREAVRSFIRLAEEIDAFKGAHQPVTQGAIDQLVATMRSLREQDRVIYERVQEQLRVE